MEEMAEKFKKIISLVSCLSGTITKVVWFVDSGASHHMTRSRDVHVELGDKGKYATKGTGSINFQMDSSGIMDVNEVLYVPGLEKISF